MITPPVPQALIATEADYKLWPVVPAGKPFGDGAVEFSVHPGGDGWPWPKRYLLQPWLEWKLSPT